LAAAGIEGSCRARIQADELSGGVLYGSSHWCYLRNEVAACWDTGKHRQGRGRNAERWLPGIRDSHGDRGRRNGPEEENGTARSGAGVVETIGRSVVEFTATFRDPATDYQIETKSVLAPMKEWVRLHTRSESPRLPALANPVCQQNGSPKSDLPVVLPGRIP
jgi:hypothetical protein